MAGEIIAEYGESVDSIKLVRGGKGRFEVIVDDEEIYSKARTKRHAEQGEVLSLMAKGTALGR